MQTEINLHLTHGERLPDVKRGKSTHTSAHWLEIGPVTIFGDPDKLDDLIDAIAELKREAA